MRKLIVHETNCHGNGYVQYNGSGFAYYHEDSGDAKEIIRDLIDIGFIKEKDVIFIEGNEIYEMLDEALADS